MSSKQRDVFRGGEGDAWHARNRSTTDDLEGRLRADPVLEAVRALRLTPKRVLEVGCGNGYRLEGLRMQFGAEGVGVEPSSEAVAEARKRFPSIDVRVGTAEDLPFEDASFDAVAFGFCLYLCDRRDLFKIAWQADRVLVEGGYLFIYDFFSPGRAYRNAYSHYEGLYSYKMDYAQLFLGNPAYSRVYHRVLPGSDGTIPLDPDEAIAVTVVRKNLGNAYPENAHVR